MQAGPTAKIALTDAEITALTKRTQEGGTEVVLAKAGKVRMDLRVCTGPRQCQEASHGCCMRLPPVALQELRMGGQPSDQDH